MGKKYNLIVSLWIISMLSLPGICVAYPLDLVYTQGNGSNMEAKGMVNWEQGVILVTGFGVPPAQYASLAQASAMARRAAVVNAYHRLLELSGDVRVEAGTTILNLENSSDLVKVKVAGVIHGARFVNEQFMPDGCYQVTLEINLFGANSLAAAVEDTIKPDKIEALAAPSASYHSRTRVAAAYTGVIVDARGLGLERVMLPRIYDDTGRMVYGNQYIDADLVARFGMADYARCQEATNTLVTSSFRAGSNPLIVKALKLQDGNSNVVISQADAEMMLTANSQTGFLARTAVVFAE